MKPDLGRVLEQTAISLLTEIAPAVSPPYRQSSVGAYGALLIAAKEEAERGAARRVAENQALRALFERAARVVDDAELAERLRSDGVGTDPDLHLTALDATNAILRERLIELHAHIEEQSGDDARAIEEAVWDELVASTERRRLPLAAF